MKIGLDKDIAATLVADLVRIQCVLSVSYERVYVCVCVYHINDVYKLSLNPNFPSASPET